MDADEPGRDLFHAQVKSLLANAPPLSPESRRRLMVFYEELQSGGEDVIPPAPGRRRAA